MAKMTPARKAALHFFHDRGEVSMETKGSPSHEMRVLMLNCGQLQKIKTWSGYTFSLTDAGRTALHEAGK